jgi:hypothetical protein
MLLLSLLTNFYLIQSDDIKQLYIENLDIINHNRNLVLSTEINDTIVSAMRQAIAIKN